MELASYKFKLPVINTEGDTFYYSPRILRHAFVIYVIYYKNEQPSGYFRAVVRV